jgi:flagellar hook assembly protein FlgD
MDINTGVVMSTDEDVLPGVFKLHQNYPNPFNPETMIQFDVPQITDLTLSVYDLLGRRVKTLVKDNLDMGSYNIKWDGSSDAGEMLPSGMYFYELHSSKFHSVKKLILVK